MRHFALCSVLLIALVTSSCDHLLLDPEAETPQLPRVHASRLATLLDSMRYALNLPALAAAVVTDTGIVEAQAVGCRRYGGAVNVTIDDKFHLGSNTKALTGVLIGVLIDEGRLTWTTTLPAAVRMHGEFAADPPGNTANRVLPISILPE